VGKLCDGIECNHLVPQPIKKPVSYPDWLN
jgi:hypothetical protein